MVCACVRVVRCESVSGYLTSVLLQRVTANCVHAAVTRTMDRNDDATGSCSNFDLLHPSLARSHAKRKTFARVLCLFDYFIFYHPHHLRPRSSLSPLSPSPSLSLALAYMLSTSRSHILCSRHDAHDTQFRNRECQSAEMLCNVFASNSRNRPTHTHSCGRSHEHTYGRAVACTRVCTMYTGCVIRIFSQLFLRFVPVDRRH